MNSDKITQAFAKMGLPRARIENAGWFNPVSLDELKLAMQAYRDVLEKTLAELSGMPDDGDVMADYVEKLRGE